MTNGTFPVDTTNPVGVVRLLVPDMTTDTGDASGDYMFSDAMLDALLGLYAQNVKRAAARAIEIVATDQALLTKVIRTDDLNVNGAVLADALLKQAQALRDDANRDDAISTDSAFTIAYGEVPWYVKGMTDDDNMFLVEGVPNGYPWL